MANMVVMNAMCQCSFGAAPAPLMVTSQTTVMGANMMSATIMDIPKPPMTFGMCRSLANPTVQSATTAANGVLTPMPCVPACPAPWTPGSPTVLVGGKPALNSNSICNCTYAGVIKISSTPATTIQIP